MVKRKMAEYWISHVKRENGHITQVNAFLNTIEGLKNPNIFNKKEVINSIDNNNDTWYTCVLKEKDKRKRVWEKGSRVHTITRDNISYIRTNPDQTSTDNLDKLPSISEITEHTFQ